jgi:hypothetical protein
MDTFQNQQAPAETTDQTRAALGALNAQYIESVARADAGRFDALLAADFHCSNPDGTVVDKKEFLRRLATSAPITHIDVDDLRIRIMEGVAIIHGRTTIAFANGTRGKGCYTDVWIKRSGQWFAVSAHVTRLMA